MPADAGKMPALPWCQGSARQLHENFRVRFPPRWTDVWICPSPKGHIQSTGRDACGRNQYPYHKRRQVILAFFGGVCGDKKFRRIGLKKAA